MDRLIPKLFMIYIVDILVCFYMYCMYLNDYFITLIFPWSDASRDGYSFVLHVPDLTLSWSFVKGKALDQLE